LIDQIESAIDRKPMQLPTLLVWAGASLCAQLFSIFIFDVEATTRSRWNPRIAIANEVTLICGRN
jgi:hypothetical protein